MLNTFPFDLIIRSFSIPMCHCEFRCNIESENIYGMKDKTALKLKEKKDGKQLCAFEANYSFKY